MDKVVRTLSVSLLSNHPSFRWGPSGFLIHIMVTPVVSMLSTFLFCLKTCRVAFRDTAQLTGLHTSLHTEPNLPSQRPS